MKFAEKLKKAMQELNLNQRQVVTLTGKSKVIEGNNNPEDEE